MASGRKNYFRHSFNAFEDEKIQNAIDKLGFEGYAYYFILIELLAKKCDEKIINPIPIHIQSLRNVWRKQSKSTKKVIEKLQESGLFVATFNGNFVEFDIPNLSKYLGKYQTKNSPNTPNKRKENKIKENKIKKEEKQSFSDLALEILEHLNAKRKELLPNAKGFSKSHLKEIQARINDGATREDLIFVIENKALDPFFIDSQYKYYRPQTLFNKTKYNNYISEQPLKSFEQADKELGDWLRSIQDNAI